MGTPPNAVTTTRSNVYIDYCDGCVEKGCMMRRYTVSLNPTLDRVFVHHCRLSFACPDLVVLCCYYYDNNATIHTPKELQSSIMRAPILRNLRSSSVSLWSPRPRVSSLVTSRQHLVAATATTTTTMGRSFSAPAGSLLSAITKENPYVDVVRYEHKNRKWSLSHVEYYAEALAIGFVENGLRPGDVVLSYLPLHFAESVRVYL